MTQTKETPFEKNRRRGGEEKKKADALRKEEAKLEKAEIARLGRLAFKAGLGEVRVTDRELVAGFSDLATRFH